MIAYPSSIAAHRGTTVPSCSKIAGARFWFWFALALTGCIFFSHVLNSFLAATDLSEAAGAAVALLVNAAWTVAIVVVEIDHRTKQLDPDAGVEGYDGPEGGAL